MRGPPHAVASNAVASDVDLSTKATPVLLYFGFILASTAARSFEAGIVSSMMPQIQSDFGITFAGEGQIAGSPDYGIVPSGLVAIFMFAHLRAQPVLVAAYFCIGSIALYCAKFPSLSTLILARAFGGLCWGLACVHYPGWIIKHGLPSQRTMWLALFQAMLLVGIILGYIIGGLARSTGFIAWSGLYALEGLLLVACGVISTFFSADLVQVVDAKADVESARAVTASPAKARAQPPTETTPLEPTSFPQSAADGVASYLCAAMPTELLRLCQCRIYVYVVGIGCSQAGVVGFLLYFITQFVENVFHISTKETTIYVSILLCVGPVGGVIGGAAWLSRIGGYQNTRHALSLVLIWVACSVTAGSILLPLATVLRSAPLLFLASLLFLAFGAMPTAAINGIAISAIPGAEHYAAGIQFALQNLAKLIVPCIGGVIMDRVGIAVGFCVTLAGSGFCLLVCAKLAYEEVCAESAG